MHSRRLFGASLAFAAATAAQQATFTTYGTGCYDQVQSFYEVFPNNGFDLGTGSGTSGFTLFYTGSGYAVVPITSTWRTPAGSGNLTLGDDAVSAAMPLGFAFPYPGGATASLWISSNGFVYLQPSIDNGCCSGSSASLLAGVPRLSPFWLDLFPPGGGTVNFEVDPALLIAYVTFTNVPEFSSGGANTFQIQLSASGQVEFLYQSCINQTHVALTGWSPGGNARDGGSRDLSAVLPLVTAPDRIPLSLRSTSRPIVGTTLTLTTRDIPAGAAHGALIVSLMRHDPGIDLTSFGMPGCLRFVGADFFNLFAVTGMTSNFLWPVPNVPSLAGLRVYCQSAVSSSSANALGWLASNGAELLVGTF